MRLALPVLTLPVLALPVLAMCLAASPAVAAPKVIASVVPVYGIVSAVMGETGQPELLLSGTMSEHRATFTVNGKRFVELSSAPGVTTHPVREGGAWEAHDHDHGHDHDHDHGHDHGHGEAAEGVLSFDPHVWLDPANAKAMAAAGAAELAKADPANAAAYTANAENFARSLDTLSDEIAADLAPVKTVPYVVFHDAYQYFEKRFGLAAAGSISDVSAAAPSAKRLREVRRKIADVKAACVFREPQFDSKVVQTVIEGTGAREGTLDPIGAGITPGPGGYQQLLKDLSKNLKACLTG